MRKSKYLGMRDGNWFCSHVGIADVQPVYCRRRVNGKRVRSKSPGSKQYYYMFERITSDKKAMKMIRLSASQINKVSKGKATVEQFAEKLTAKRSMAFKDKVSYSFCD